MYILWTQNTKEDGTGGHEAHEVDGGVPVDDDALGVETGEALRAVGHGVEVVEGRLEGQRREVHPQLEGLAHRDLEARLHHAVRLPGKTAFVKSEPANNNKLLTHGGVVREDHGALGGSQGEVEDLGIEEVDDADRQVLGDGIVEDGVDEEAAVVAEHGVRLHVGGEAHGVAVQVRVDLQGLGPLARNVLQLGGVRRDGDLAALDGCREEF